MPPATKLRVKDSLAGKLLEALQRGEIDSTITGRELKNIDHPLSNLLRLYDTKSLSNVMAAFRKKLDGDGMFIVQLTRILSNMQYYSGIGTRSSAGPITRARIVPLDDEKKEDDLLQPVLSESKFSFIPIHRLYTFESGGVPTRTYVMAEINLPSGVKPENCWVEVVDGGMVLQLTVEWPEYMSNPVTFNASWLKQSDLLLQSSRITSSWKNVQDLRRQFGEVTLKSTARITIPRKVYEDISNLEIAKLGFVDSSTGDFKANGLALQVHLLAVEDFSMKILPEVATSHFTIVGSENSTKEIITSSVLSSSITK